MEWLSELDRRLEETFLKPPSSERGNENEGDERPEIVRVVLGGHSEEQRPHAKKEEAEEVEGLVNLPLNDDDDAANDAADADTFWEDFDEQYEKRKTLPVPETKPDNADESSNQKDDDDDVEEKEEEKDVAPSSQEPRRAPSPTSSPPSTTTTTATIATRTALQRSPSPPPTPKSPPSPKIPPPSPLPQAPWSSAVAPSRALHNRRGVVRARLLRAEHLPCAAGTEVRASSSLAPWRGRVRSRPARTSRERLPATPTEVLRPRSRIVAFEEDAVLELSHPCNNGVDTPFPKLVVSVSDAWGRAVATVEADCAPLLAEPGVAKRGRFVGAAAGRSIDALLARASGEEPPPAPAVCVEATFAAANEDADDGGTGRHLFRTAPASSSFARRWWCPVCEGPTVTGWRRWGHVCERCSLRVCADCCAAADVRLPCGAEAARRVVEESEQGRVTLARIVDMVAPKAASNTKKGEDDDDVRKANGKDGENQSRALMNPDDDHLRNVDPSSSPSSLEEGIATLDVRVVEARVFDRPLPPETDVRRLSTPPRTAPPSDHYARVVSSRDVDSSSSRRTRTAYGTSAPLFDERLDTIHVRDYGEEFRVDLTDAVTDEPVGAHVLSVQGVLRRRRDDLDDDDDRPGLSWATLRETLRPSDRDSDVLPSPPHRMVLALRSGLSRGGFGREFASDAAGAVVGLVVVELVLRERPDVLSLTPRRVCPPRLPDEFAVDVVQRHAARAAALVEDVKGVVTWIAWWVSWKRPAATMGALVIFVVTCLKFDAERAASLPVAGALLWTTAKGIRRRRRRDDGDDFKTRWVGKERKSRIEAERELTRSCIVHRPIARLRASVTRGRHLRSRELGIPGSCYVSLHYDPLRNADPAERKAISEADAASSCVHDLGTTWISGISADPVWDRRDESDESRRLRRLLSPSDVFRYDNNDDDENDDGPRDPDLDLVFPVLQPVRPTKDENNNNNDDGTVELVPWERAPGALVLQLRFDKLFNSLSAIDDVLGEVSIPLAELSTRPRLRGWFRVADPGTTAGPVRVDDDDDDEDDVPAIFLRVDLDTPSPTAATNASERERECSVVVAEEMIRTARRSRDLKSLGSVIGSSVKTFDTMRGLRGSLQGLQNQLGGVLDLVEALQNAFTWSSNPQQSMVIFLLTAMLWLVLFLVPGRYLILCGGLGVFCYNFMLEFRIIKPAEKKTDNAPNVLTNFINSLPTDEDMRRTYFWESRRVGEEERKRQARSKRNARLKVLWKANWFSELRMKTAHDYHRRRLSSSSSSPGEEARGWDWEPIFAIVQGHRLVWFQSEKEFDEGDPPLGYILFAGHSGVASLSPLELRELRKEEITLAVNIFGRGVDGQQKITFLTPNEEAKNKMMGAVIEATTNSKQD